VATRPVMLLVLGPHRSGTSLTARMLECFGAENSHNLNPPNFANPKGHFEDWDIYQFNENVLLPSLLERWEHTCAVDWSTVSKTERSRLGMQALEILRRNYPLSRSLSILKEPRINNTLPFWLSIIEHAGFEVRPVCVVRDPVSVARSLHTRDGFSITRGGMIYLSAWLSALPHLQDRKTAFVHYDEIFASPSTSLLAVARALALPVPEDFDQRVHEFSSSHLDPGMRHSAVHRDDVQLEPDLPPPVIDLYRTLLDATQSQNVRKTAKFLSRTESFLANISPLLADYDTASTASDAARVETEALRQQQAQLQAELSAARQSDHAALSNERSALDARLSALTAEHSDLATRQTSLVTERDALAAERDTLAARVSSLESENSQLVTSQSSLVTENEALRAGHSSLVRSQEALVAEHNRLANDLKDSSDQRSSLATKLDTTRSERDALAQERDTLKSSLVELQAHHESLQLKHSVFMDDFANAARELDFQKTQLSVKQDSLEGERSELLGRLNRAEALLADQQQDLTISISERETLLSRITALEDERAQVIGSLDTSNSHCKDLEHSLATRFKELAALAEELSRQQRQLALATAKARLTDGVAFSIGDMQVREYHDVGPHQHVSFDCYNVELASSLIARLTVRLVCHHGKPGISIFRDPSQVFPIRRWVESGREGPWPYMLLVLGDTHTHKWAENAGGSDFHIVSFFATALVQAIARAQPTRTREQGTSERSRHSWLPVAHAFVAGWSSLQPAFRFDDCRIAVQQSDSGQARHVELTGASFAGSFVPSISFSLLRNVLSLRMIVPLNQKGTVFDSSDNDSTSLDVKLAPRATKSGIVWMPVKTRSMSPIQANWLDAIASALSRIGSPPPAGVGPTTQ